MGKILRLMSLALSAVVLLTLCGCDDDEKSNQSRIPEWIIGTWGGSQTVGKTGSTRTLLVTFYADGSGDLTYESSVYYRAAYFSYTVSGTTINCKGVMAGEDGEVDENWTQSFEYYGSYITPIGAYSDITLYKAGSEYDNDDDNYGGGTGSGGSSGGSGSGSSGFDYTIGFDNDWASSYHNGIYTHQIFMGFGVPKGTYTRGISSFGIGIKTDDGTIDNKYGHDKFADWYVSTERINGVSMKCFEGVLTNGDRDYNWSGLVYITSKNKTITLEYAPRYYDDNRHQYVDGASRTYTYTPKEISEY